MHRRRLPALCAAAILWVLLPGPVLQALQQADLPAEALAAVVRSQAVQRHDAGHQLHRGGGLHRHLGAVLPGPQPSAAVQWQGHRGQRLGGQIGGCGQRCTGQWRLQDHGAAGCRHAQQQGQAAQQVGFHAAGAGGRS